MNTVISTRLNFVEKLQLLNPEIQIEAEFSSIIKCVENPKNLRYPKGFTYDPETGLICKKNTNSPYKCYIPVRPDGALW